MKPLFLYYAGLRLRLFLREILQLHQRFLIGFLFIFGMVLSGHEQLALRRAMAHLLSFQTFTWADLGLIVLVLGYALLAAAVVRRSARGGQVRYLVESLPLPFAWERATRVLLLSLVNLSPLLLFAMGLQQLLLDHQSWLPGMLLAAAYLVWILALQLAVLEQSWGLLPVCTLAELLLVWGKGSVLITALLLSSLAFIIWSLRRPEPRPRAHPNFHFASWAARWRSTLTQRLPAQFMLQSSYVLARPALLLYCLSLTLLVHAALFKILAEAIPQSQQVHVYTCASGFLSVLCSSFFRNFYQLRLGYQPWLQSLPRSPGWWLRQDLGFVLALYLLLTLPFAIALACRHELPWPLPLLVLPIHSLGLLGLSRLQRSEHALSSLVLFLGLGFWFVLVGYLCDHLLRSFA